MRGLPHASGRTMPIIVRRRRSFGLDAPRVPDPRRTERAVVAWLATAIPGIIPLRIAGPAGMDREDPAERNREGLAMALLLPRGQVAVLQIEGRSDHLGPQTMALLKGCQSRRVPVAVIHNLDEARAALRRFGFEPQDN